MKTPAKFDKKTKEKILERDWNRCIICWDIPHSIHHVFFWIQSNFWLNRNEKNQWVTLCYKCHCDCHSSAIWEWKRQDCINYVKNYE